MEIICPKAIASWSEDERQWGLAVLRNAARLLDDAALLASYKRFATAVSLSVLSLEETGKVALKIFGEGPKVDGKRGRSNIHVRKQLAATALLQAEFGERTIREKLDGWGLADDDPRTPEQAQELRETLAMAIFASRENRLLEYIRLGATERVKHLGIYVDEWHIEWGLKGETMSEEQFQEIYSEARRALPLLSDYRAISIAEAIYSLELQLPHIPPSSKLPNRAPSPIEPI